MAVVGRSLGLSLSELLLSRVVVWVFFVDSRLVMAVGRRLGRSHSLGELLGVLVLSVWAGVDWALGAWQLGAVWAPT